MIERIALSQGARHVGRYPATNTIAYRFGNYTAEGASVIRATAGRHRRIDGAAYKPVVPDRPGVLCQSSYPKSM